MSDLQVVLKCCNICFDESLTLDRVLFFQCGHRVCTSCVKRVNNLCPVCRKKSTPHRIFLTLDELEDERPNQVVEGLKKINKDTPAISMEKASGKILRLHNRTTGADSATSKALLDAATDLRERLAPLAVLWAETKTENAELLKRLHQLEAKKEAYKQTAGRAKKIAQEEKDEAHRHRETAEIYVSALNKKEKEILRLQEALEEEGKQLCLMKTKLKALVRAQKRLTIPDPDTSLQVEGQPETFPQRRIKRRPETLLQELNTQSPSRELKRRKGTGPRKQIESNYEYL